MLTIDQRTPFRIESRCATPTPGAVAWRSNLRPEQTGPVLVVQAGHGVTFEGLAVSPGDRLRLRYGPALPAISDDGLTISVQARGSSAALFEATVTSDTPWREISVPLDGGGELALTIRCGAGDRGDARADWLGLAGLQIGPAGPGGPASPHGGRNAFAHALGIIQARCLLDPIHFAGRATELSRHRRLDVITIGCRGARIERSLFSQAAHAPRMTLMGDDESQLRGAEAELAGVASTTILCGDVDDLRLPERAFDVAVCVAGLHRVAGLERVTSRIAASLRPGGEFWSIGEYVGRPGARLWPESLEVADELFRSLPARYRVNHVAAAGPPRVDETLRNGGPPGSEPGGFRPDEIETVLHGHFEPLHVDRWSTIAWRVLGPAYVGNYDMDDVDDVARIEAIAAADVEHLLSGRLRPVAMRGVFRPRPPGAAGDPAAGVTGNRGLRAP